VAADDEDIVVVVGLVSYLQKKEGKSFQFYEKKRVEIIFFSQEYMKVFDLYFLIYVNFTYAFFFFEILKISLALRKI
jgi:hypothetical protein